MKIKDKLVKVKKKKIAVKQQSSLIVNYFAQKNQTNQHFSKIESLTGICAKQK